ncbi:MAG: response regulator, partial [Bacilli bacterium]|nr:response regulator [Bacilli bacterium]
IYLFFLLVIFRKKLPFRKIIPLYLFIIGGTICGVLQQINSEYLLMTCVESLICFAMYHTIENPDLEIISQLEKARDEANRANKAKSEFLSSMSHEIRTPLNAIIGFSEFILDSDSIEDAHATAKDVVSASQTLLETVNGILDISKVESGKLEIIEDNYNLKELLDNTVRMAKARMGDKQLDLRVHFAADLPDTLYGDKNNLNKVIINLLTNAIKYTKEGYIDYSVQCAKAQDVCRLIITVKDTGIGIKKENIDKLFTRFQRFDEKSNGTIEGTGLGLAITKQLVEMMGGNIVVSSIYGEGSNFTVALDQRISLINVQREDIQEREYRFDLHDKKILVVDDNNLNLKLAERIFLKYNCKVQCVTSGFECLDYINKGYKYDLILLDDVMPKMLGSETLTRLKRIENFTTPVIALTANAIAGMKEKYLLLGFDDYLAKPIEKDELEIVLKKFLLENKEAKKLSEDVLTSSKPISVIDEETKDSILSSVSSKNAVVVEAGNTKAETPAPVASAEVEKKETSQVEGIKFNDKGGSAEIVIPQNEEFTNYSDRRILVVDDNKLNLKVALKFLSRYKFQEDEAYSGEECIEKVKNGEHYDIIFMDIMMPNLNGVETFHELQKVEGFNIPVVVALTADAVEGAKEKYLKEGFAEYISKPIVRERLDKVIHKVLDKE